MADGHKFQKILQNDEVTKILENYFGNKDFHVISFEVKPASENPMGFLGEHYTLMIHVNFLNETKKLSFFVKKIPTDVPQHFEYATKTKAFYKEIELYKTLFLDLKNAQKTAQNVTKWCPECFYFRGEELLVLENLLNSGYYMYSERTMMDEEHVKVSLKAMAAMHAASFVFEEKFNAGKMETFSPRFENVKRGKTTIGEVYSHLTFETEASDEKGHPGNTYHEAGIRSQVMIADLLPEYSKEDKEIIRKKLPEVLRYSYQIVKPSQRFKNVFVHGDLWSNNILFKKDESGKVKEALLIDFQLARYAPPAHDVMMFLHLVQNKKFLEAKMQELLAYYYDAFTEELAKNSLKGEVLLPWETFIESCNFYEDLGLISKLFYYQVILAPPNIASKFMSTPDLFTQNMLVDRSEMVLECFHQDDMCKSRITEAINDVIKKFILI